MQNPAIEYDYTVAKWFSYLAILFGILGMGIGVLIAFQMAFPELNYIFGEYSLFSRLRPIHTNVVIYGFTLSGIWATWYYVGQRVLKVSLKESPLLNGIAKAHFWLYFITALAAVISLLLRYTTSKEYAQFEWPIDVLIVVIWVMWGIGIFGLIGLRREKTLYISIWYYIATFLGVAMLYLFNNMEVPTYFVAGMGDIFHSVSMYTGSNDALVQWWFGHNAVAFVFTVPIIAMIYYYLPKE
ncbi:MAG TPA: cytochrome C oxidase Cbb3, partial [Campylobacterales bacterium]|nr:cytochrome C oxidase Cbb3 [Campylobacterales bacterium]